MGKLNRTLDKIPTMKSRVRQTVTPEISKIVGEPRSPHHFSASAVDPEQSHGSRTACRASKPKNKDGYRRSPSLREVLVMDTNGFVGIDVSKDRLDGAVRNGPSFQEDNSSAGIAKVVAFLQARPTTLVVSEATGGLEVPLARALQKAQIPIAIVNPLRVREFAKSTGALAKTDRIDAAVLAHFGEAIRPEPRPLPDEQTQALDALVTRRMQLIDMRTMENNRLASCADRKVRTNIKKHLEWLERNIEDADRDLGEAVKNNSDWQARDKLQQSVPGIGKVVSHTLLASLPELGKLSNKKVVALVGLAPYAHDSGKHKGNRRVFGGRAEVRNKLYMAALTVTRTATPLGNFFRRLRDQGKEFKVALIAVARKLLTVVNAVVRNGVPFDAAHAV